MVWEIQDDPRESGTVQRLLWVCPEEAGFPLSCVTAAHRRHTLIETVNECKEESKSWSVISETPDTCRSFRDTNAEVISVEETVFLMWLEESNTVFEDCKSGPNRGLIRIQALDNTLSVFSQQSLQFLRRPVLHCSIPLTSQTPCSPPSPRLSRRRRIWRVPAALNSNTEVRSSDIPPATNQTLTCSSTFCFETKPELDSHSFFHNTLLLFIENRSDISSAIREALLTAMLFSLSKPYKELHPRTFTKRTFILWNIWAKTSWRSFP